MSAVTCSECDTEQRFPFSEDFIKGCTYDCTGCGRVMKINRDLTTVDLYSQMALDLYAKTGIATTSSDWSFFVHPEESQ